jgi:4-carboxymuconolactone decarboxylase
MPNLRANPELCYEGSLSTPRFTGRFSSGILHSDMKILHAFLVLGLTQAAQVLAQDRLPPIPASQLTEAQKKVVADYKELRKADLTGPPWAVMLRVPDWVMPALEMRMHVLNHNVLGNKLTEFAILIAAREWTNNYEWNAHSAAAATAGLSAAIVAAVADGRRPEHMAEDEEIIYDFCAELQHNKSVSDPTYARALAKFGEPGVVELANIEGYYVYLSMVMNTARSPLPAGAKAALTPFPK